MDKLPVAVVRHVKEGLAGRVQETPKEGDKCFEFARNFVIGSAETAAVVVKEQLEKVYTIGCISEIERDGRNANRRWNKCKE